ncbi:MAG: RagB/SusD family nutrient uptake outer membrane protein [Bacteroidota bacterium]
MTFFQRKLLVAAVALTTTAGVGCDFNIEDPNRVGEDAVFNTRDGLVNAAIGLQQLYNVGALDNVVVTSAITTRELAANTTFANLLELEDGGATLDNTNATVGNLFLQLNRVLGFAEDIDAGVRATSAVGAEPDLEAGLLALASFYRAVAIGTMAQNFEQVALETDFDGEATYASNDEAFERAADLLEEAEALLATDGAAAAIPTPAGFDLLNTVRAYRARYELFAGNDQAAIDAADRVDEGATSTFAYNADARNPLFVELVNGTPDYEARDNLGLDGLDPADGRIAFYTAPLAETSEPNGFDIDDVTGFAAGGPEATLPAFLPGELDLIRAEASLNLGRTDDAVDFIDAVRTKSATDDPFGVGAGLGAYGGAEDDASLRQEIFLQRSAELYLQGLRLVDSRRLGGQDVGSGPFERTRTFYPYPFQERNANPNTPADPAI